MVHLTKNGKSDHRAVIHLITLIYFCKHWKAKCKFGRHLEGKVDKTRQKVERGSNKYANVRHIVVIENRILHSGAVPFKTSLLQAIHSLGKTKTLRAC